MGRYLKDKATTKKVTNTPDYLPRIEEYNVYINAAKITEKLVFSLVNEIKKLKEQQEEDQHLIKVGRQALKIVEDFSSSKVSVARDTKKIPKDLVNASRAAIAVHKSRGAVEYQARIEAIKTYSHPQTGQKMYSLKEVKSLW